jgi:hypothetical protein
MLNSEHRIQDSRSGGLVILELDIECVVVVTQRFAGPRSRHSPEFANKYHSWREDFDPEGLLGRVPLEHKMRPVTDCASYDLERVRPSTAPSKAALLGH